jgi:hypothetical protein
MPMLRQMRHKLNNTNTPITTTFNSIALFTIETLGSVQSFHRPSFSALIHLLLVFTRPTFVSLPTPLMKCLDTAH